MELGASGHQSGRGRLINRGANRAVTIELDNNPVERTIRPIALNRKNALFAGHDTGAQNWAVIASLIETFKPNGIEPHGYLSGVLTAIAGGHKQADIKELLPWNYTAPV